MAAPAIKKNACTRRSFFIAKTPTGAFSGLKSGESGKVGTEHDQADEKDRGRRRKHQCER
ncbi:hypothetical protein GA512_09140 [Bacillus paralicheniformis]|nr:hypothetical protein [Bacillus paralicheniformis]